MVGVPGIGGIPGVPGMLVGGPGGLGTTAGGQGTQMTGQKRNTHCAGTIWPASIQIVMLGGVPG